MRRSFIPAAAASSYETVAEILKMRGFHWKYLVPAEAVQSQSYDIAFLDEWNVWMDRVQEITQMTPSKVTAKTKTPWEHFQKVIHPDRNRKDERSFSKALFRALRSSLGKFVDKDTSDANCIVLKNSRIGFRRGIQLKRLGFPDGYALSADSESTHGCFVLGSDNGDVNDSEKEFWYDDLTAVVNLKLDKTSCKGLSAFESMFVPTPNLRKEHGPMGQAMCYSMDVWHCLARRGVQVPSIPVVVLAGQSKITAAKQSLESSPICCLEAQLQIPVYFGSTFQYSVERIVSFDGTTGLKVDKASCANTALESRKSRDERAIAIYVRTMRMGLEHAIEISKHRSFSVSNRPVSLCCRNLLRGDSDAELIASPIPREDRLNNPFFHINQGELFQLTKPTKSTFSCIEPIDWFTDATEHDILIDNCLVKVSCASVHHTYVKFHVCYEAMRDLHRACERNSDLQEEISKVLLGFRATNDVFFVSVMKDLRNDGYFLLDHQRIRGANKLPELWAAFCTLVQTVLLPMAHEDIIHVDIRSTSETTYNILCHYDTLNGMKLCLIDFESLILSQVAVYANLVVQKHAVHWELNWTSSYTYLFWQMLWIAYTWYPVSLASMASECLPKEPNAQNFVLFLFTDHYFIDFKHWLGMERVDALKKIAESNTTTAAAIETALDVMTHAFVKPVPK